MERDMLRMGTEQAEVGYTLEEAAIMSRSSVAGQRVAALLLIAAVICRARQGMRWVINGLNLF